MRLVLSVFFPTVSLISSYSSISKNILNKYRKTSNRVIYDGPGKQYINFSDVQQDIDRYLEYRKVAQLPPIDEDKINTKIPNALSMLSPSGWFKDERALDLKRRTDTRVPSKLHPLSYIELERHGFGHLTEIIMDLGGPRAVGRRIGIDWTEPEKKRGNPEDAPVEERNYAMDFQGKLVLGNALEERLALAEDIDAESLKKDIERKFLLQSGNRTSNSVDPQGEDYRSRKWTRRGDISSSVLDEENKDEESFSLNSPQRVYLLFVLSTFSLSYGRASHEIIANNMWNDLGASLLQNFYIISSASLLLSFTCGALCWRTASQKNRNSILWAALGFFGGPLSYFSICDLEPLVGTPSSDVTK